MLRIEMNRLSALNCIVSSAGVSGGSITRPEVFSGRIARLHSCTCGAVLLRVYVCVCIV